MSATVNEYLTEKKVIKSHAMGCVQIKNRKIGEKAVLQLRKSRLKKNSLTDAV